jgi:hypothetical protein
MDVSSAEDIKLCRYYVTLEVVEWSLAYSSRGKNNASNSKFLSDYSRRLPGCSISQ